MKEHRHPHPHIDPRQPRAEARPAVNPPVFAWKPLEGAVSYELLVARDAAFSDLALRCKGLADPMFLPTRAFAPGVYYWKWTALDRESEVFRFEIGGDAVRLEVPEVSEWFKRMPAEHPRIWARPEELESLRASRGGDRADLWSTLEGEAEALLEEPRQISEPDYLPNRDLEYDNFAKAFFEVMWTSREFVRGAEKLALAYLASGDARYARAACERMVSICGWDPRGSSYLGHNDEAHMSSVWWGPTAVDWVWDCFTEAERLVVVEHLRQRGEITFDHMHNRGAYGVARFDSHAGREIVFLAQIAFLLYRECPEEASRWLDWLRPVLCGIWPVWAGDDGGWAEGISYSLAYVHIMSRFVFALRKATGIDLFRKPFWGNHADWRMWCFPAYAEWIGFGDHSERWAETWGENGNLVDIIDRGTGRHGCGDYVEEFRVAAEKAARRFPEAGGRVNPLIYLLPRSGGGAAPGGERRAPDGMLKVFPAVGWAALRTNMSEAADDVAFLFRSSPLGAISHSHANNNDFILHVGGKVLAMPSGYYASYASPHHACWVWHTKSHNCATLSDAGQLMRDPESTGRVAHPFENDALVYFCGVADASVRHLADRYRRHVVFLKGPRCFFLLDEFVAKPGVVVSYQWNIHSWAKFEGDEGERRFRLEREGSSLDGYFLYHSTAYMALTEGWEPRFMEWKRNEQWLDQYHLRFATGVPLGRVNMGVVLCPRSGGAAPPVERSVENGVERATVGEDLFFVRQGKAIDLEGAGPDTLAVLRVAGRYYDIDDAGIRLVDRKDSK